MVKEERMTSWTLKDIPDLSDKVALVTGGNVGLGFRSALELAKKGARVFITCREKATGERAKEDISTRCTHARVDVVPLDLTNDISIGTCAKEVMSKTDRLDILLNNAGVVNLEGLHRAESGIELHVATNHLGHFALTGLLFKLLETTPDARVVTVSSGSWRLGEIDFSDFKWEKRQYDKMKAYGDSKLANLLFMHSLQMRFDERSNHALSVGAHPGLTGTERQQSIGAGGVFAQWVASPVSNGVRHQLFAATAKSVKGRDFYGPRYVIRGPVQKLTLKGRAVDEEVAAHLWDVSEELTGVYYPSP